MLTLYGISNCDTVKKARAWLDAQALEYAFHDYKKAGIDTATLRRWCTVLGYEQLVNRRGTTWRKLPEAERSGLDEARALQLMQAQPSLIKRPLLDANGTLLLGFNETQWRSLL